MLCVAQANQRPGLGPVLRHVPDVPRSPLLPVHLVTMAGEPWRGKEAVEVCIKAALGNDKATVMHK